VFALFFFTQTIAAGEQLDDDDAEETEFWHQIEVHQVCAFLSFFSLPCS
jgi:hypothetical protein